MPDVEPWLGTYRGDQAATPRQRRLLLRLELPGVPVADAEHLRDAVAAARNDPPPASPPQPEQRRDDDEGWDGPFRRG